MAQAMRGSGVSSPARLEMFVRRLQMGSGTTSPHRLTSPFRLEAVSLGQLLGVKGGQEGVSGLPEPRSSPGPAAG